MIRIDGISRQKAGETADALLKLLGKYKYDVPGDSFNFLLIDDLYKALRDVERAPCPTSSSPSTRSGDSVP